MSTVSCTVTNQASILDQSTGTLANAFFPITQKYTSTLTSPTKEYAAQRTTSGETIDLTATLSNPFGTTLNFANVAYLYIENTDAAKTLTIGGGTSAFSTDQFTIAPLCNLSLTCSYTIDGTHKNLKVLPSSGSVIYNLIVVGT